MKLSKKVRAEAAEGGRSDTELACRVCGAGTKLVSRTTQMLKVQGKRRLHAATVCSNLACQREAWSRHPKALEISRMLDAKAKADAKL
jgi:hypothetical protein